MSEELTEEKLNWRNGSYLQLWKQSGKGWHGRGHAGDLDCYRTLPGLDVLPPVFLLLDAWLSSVFHDSWNLAHRKSYEGQRVDVGFSFDKESYDFGLEMSCPDRLSVEVLPLFILTTFGSRSAFLCVSSPSLSGDCSILVLWILKSPKTKFILQIHSLFYIAFSLEDCD